MNSTIYPLMFSPILKNTIWGGSEICSFKGIKPVQTQVGESWEVSHVEENYSIVSNGKLAGRTIDELIKSYGSELLGVNVLKHHGSTFPVLIKFIDAADDLSIQVHPNDSLAKERHNSSGKTEMWYVVKASEGASLYTGFSRRIDVDEYLERVANNTLVDVLHRYEVKEGDVFFLPAGRVHAICKGCMIAEIQQTSNITYRIFDYNRKDANGNSRELHTELARDAINFCVFKDYRTAYTPKQDIAVTLAYSRFFVTRLVDISKEWVRDCQRLDSFVIYICLEGGFTLTDDKGHVQEVRQGETVLLPAVTEKVSISPRPHTKVLETYMDYVLEQ